MVHPRDYIFCSVVVPLMNEEENVRALHRSLKAAMGGLGRPYELIFVDDGSTDRTFEILRDLQLQEPGLRIVKFRRNFGQSAAMAAGFELACGELIITMDGDLQNDPNDIPRLLQKIEEGFDMVSGWRKNRQDKFLIRKVPSKIANRIIMKLTGVRLHDTGCSLKIYRRELIKRIRLYGELHRFIPVLGRIEGARISEMVVNHHPRRFGKSKYNISRTFKVIMDLTTLNLFLKYFENPLHFFGVVGFLFTTFGIVALIATAYFALSPEIAIPETNLLLSTTFLYMAGGFQLLLFGLIANMVVKTGNKRNGQLYEVYSKDPKAVI